MRQDWTQHADGHWSHQLAPHWEAVPEDYAPAPYVLRVFPSGSEHYRWEVLRSDGVLQSGIANRLDEAKRAARDSLETSGVAPRRRYAQARDEAVQGETSKTRKHARAIAVILLSLNLAMQLYDYIVAGGNTTELLVGLTALMSVLVLVYNAHYIRS